MKIVLAIVGTIVLLTFGVAVEIYRWNDCRAVGHTWLYCVLNLGR